MKERALLVAIEFQSRPRETTLENFAKELEELASSAGLEVVQCLKTRPKNPSPEFLIGEGKAQELKAIHAQNTK